MLIAYGRSAAHREPHFLSIGKHVNEFGTGLIRNAHLATEERSWLFGMYSVRLPEVYSGNVAHPSVFYNGMVAPLMPYGIRGAIWYQGESNTNRPALYQEIFSAVDVVIQRHGLHAERGAEPPPRELPQIGLIDQGHRTISVEASGPRGSVWLLFG